MTDSAPDHADHGDGDSDGRGGDAAWAEREVRQAAAYDQIGERYDEAFPHKEGQLACGQWLLGQLPAGASVLDLGCGTGLPTARQLAEGGCAVTGVDISQRMLEQARSNVPGARFLELDIMDLAGLGGSFAAVTAFFSLLNLPRRAMPGALRLIRDVLDPGGLLCLAMVEADVDDFPIEFLGGRIRVTGYPRDEFRALLGDAGLAVESERALSYAPASAEAAPEIQLFMNCRRL